MILYKNSSEIIGKIFGVVLQKKMYRNDFKNFGVQNVISLRITEINEALCATTVFYKCFKVR